MKNNLSNERIEKIMGSLDGVHKAEAPDFFYTRLSGKMQINEEDRKPFFLLRPAFITTVLSVLLIINVISLLKIDKTAEQYSTAKADKPATIESFAKAYNLNTGSVYQ